MIQRSLLLLLLTLLCAAPLNAQNDAGRNIDDVVERALERASTPGAPRLKSDDLVLPIRPLPDGAFGALLDGRAGLTFRILTDAHGSTYLWLGDRALAREDPKPRS